MVQRSARRLGELLDRVDRVPDAVINPHGGAEVEAYSHPLLSQSIGSGLLRLVAEPCLGTLEWDPHGLLGGRGDPE